MRDIDKWLSANRDKLTQDGFSLETKGDDNAVTVIAESNAVVFQLTEWPGKALEFHSISYAEDRVIPVAEARAHLSVEEKCDYYLRQVEAYVASRA